jgi:thermitase
VSFRAGALLIVCATTAAGLAPGVASAATRDGLPDRVVVAFEDDATQHERADALHDAHATDSRPLTSLPGLTAVTVADGSGDHAADELERADGVAFAQADVRVRAALAQPANGFQQWGLENPGQPGVDGNFPAAWDVSTGDRAYPIAVVDTGVDLSIRDLRTNAKTGRDFIDGDDDAAPGPPAAADEDATSHGTHVAGIAAASLEVSQPDEDITGGAPNAGILPVRALGPDGEGNASDVASGFAWAADHGARVVNASLSGVGRSVAMENAIAAHPDTLFVVAAGNGDAYRHGLDEDALPEDERDYPCATPASNVVCVAAVDARGALASFSNYGATSVDVGAPGVRISSYLAGGSLASWNGTSMAAPFVAAAAELAFAHTPTATAAQVRAAIVATARPLQSLAGKTASGGMIDAAALLQRTTALPVQATPAPATTPPATAPAAPEPAAAEPASPAPAVNEPAAPASTRPTPSEATPTPRLALKRPRRQGSAVRVDGTVTGTWQGTVTIKACAGRRCSTTRVRARRGGFGATLRVPRGARLTVTASGRGVRSATRTL